MKRIVDLACFAVAFLASVYVDSIFYACALVVCANVSLWHFFHPTISIKGSSAEEVTQREIDGVAAVFRSVEDDATARGSAYIMTKKFKRVFAEG